jgi:hypothetical protein
MKKQQLAMIVMASNGKNINICPILTIFLCDPTPFVAHWVVTAPISIGYKGKDDMK